MSIEGTKILLFPYYIPKENEMSKTKEQIYFTKQLVARSFPPFIKAPEPFSTQK